MGRVEKHGNTLVPKLGKIYDAAFAPGFIDRSKISDVLVALEDPSLSKLVKDHTAGGFEGNISRHG